MGNYTIKMGYSQGLSWVSPWIGPVYAATLNFWGPEINKTGSGRSATRARRHSSSWAVLMVNLGTGFSQFWSKSAITRPMAYSKEISSSARRVWGVSPANGGVSRKDTMARAL